MLHHWWFGHVLVRVTGSLVPRRTSGGLT